MAIHRSVKNGKVKAALPVAVACATAMACSESGRLSPVAPDAVSVVSHTQSPLANQDQSEGASIQEIGPHIAMAVGHAERLSNQAILEEAYSFTARSTGMPVAADGQVEMYRYIRVDAPGDTSTIHARVTCLAVVGNEAWIGSRVTLHILNGEQIPDNRSMVFRVQDGGNPSNAIDFASLAFFSPLADYDLNHCTTRPAAPTLRSVDNGNITVTSRP